MIYIEGQIWELADLRVVRHIAWTNNSKIAKFLESNFSVSNWIFFRHLLIFQYGKFEKFSIRKIWKTCNLKNSKNLKICNFENSKDFQFRKFQKIQFGKFQKFPIWKLRKNFNLANSKNLQFEKFRKSPKFYNSAKHKISEIA